MNEPPRPRGCARGSRGKAGAEGGRSRRGEGPRRRAGPRRRPGRAALSSAGPEALPGDGRKFPRCRSDSAAAMAVPSWLERLRAADKTALVQDGNGGARVRTAPACPRRGVWGGSAASGRSWAQPRTASRAPGKDTRPSTRAVGRGPGSETGSRTIG